MANLLEKKIYGLLLTTGKMYRNNASRRMIECVCECGNIVWVRQEYLQIEKTKSCGCLKVKHGLLKHPLYTAWRNMITRCYYPCHEDYKNYGGCGITVNDSWRKGFQAFFDWAIDNGWMEGLTLDRIKNTIGYSPENCRWASQYEQQRNKTNNVNITAFGETKCVADWVRDDRCNVSFNTIRNRMIKGATAEDAITIIYKN